jgi:hypothetical protein
MNNKDTQGGFIGKIILIVIALILVKYFLHFDIIEWIKSEQGQKIFGPVINFIKWFYNYVDNFVRNLVS